jgi:general secretion pathway protein C
MMTLFLAASAWLLGSMVWLPFSQTSVQAWQVQLSNEAVTTSSVNVSEIQKRNLFGQYQAQAADKASKPVVQDAPETRLALSLVGVVSVEPAQKSLAIIANKGQQATYGIGERIDGTRAEVSAVYSDRVVINNAGRNETLMLLDVAYNNRTVERPSRRQSAAERPNVDYNRETPAEADSLEGIKQKIMGDPSQLFQYVRLSALKRDDQVVGYTLSPGRSAELFNSVGLEKGDIATQINGIDLTEQDAIGKLMPLMQDLTEVNLTVERDGEPYEIYIQF